jgi:hypothetical protein
LHCLLRVGCNYCRVGFLQHVLCCCTQLCRTRTVRLSFLCFPQLCSVACCATISAPGCSPDTWYMQPPAAHGVPSGPDLVWSAGLSTHPVSLCELCVLHTLRQPSASTVQRRWEPGCGRCWCHSSQYQRTAALLSTGSASCPLLDLHPPAQGQSLCR